MTFRLLQIGAGNRGRMWAEVARRHGGATVAAIVDPSATSLALFADTNPKVPAFSSIEAALTAGPYDGSVLVTPPDGHLDQCRRLFGAGLPILAEKPLATTLDDAAAIVEMADTFGLPLTVGLNFRYLPVNQTMRDWLARKALGQVGFGQFIYRTNRNGRRPGINRYPLDMKHVMMLEQSIHHLDLIRFVHAQEVVRIAAREWNPPWSMYAHDANVSCLLTLADGAEVNYFGTWSGGWDKYLFEWRIDCAEGVLVQQKLHSDLAYARSADADLTPITIDAAEPYYDDSVPLLDGFISAVRGNGPVPCDGRDHLRTLALCFAGIESGQTGKTIEMENYYAQQGLARLL